MAILKLLEYLDVTPAKAGAQSLFWIPTFVGMTT